MKKLLLFLIAVALFAGCNDDSRTGSQTQNPVPTASNPAVQNGSQPAAALEAHFSVKPKDGSITTNFQFDGSASLGAITKFNWDFGDGKSAGGKSVNHKYAKAGTYKVKLTVSTAGNQKASLNKSVKVGSGGGGGGGGQACTNPAPNRGFINGTVTDVQGFNAIVKLDSNATCANSYYYCGDMRRKSPEAFRGIIHGMSDLGNHTFSVFNDCPAHWPPDIGERVFLYWKSCSQNYCP